MPRRAQPRRSTACQAQALRCIPTSCAPSCSVARVLTSGGSGADRSERPFVEAKQAMDLSAVLHEVRLGLQDQHGGDRGYDLRGREGRGALHLARRSAAGTTRLRSRRRASRPTRRATPSWRRPMTSCWPLGSPPGHGRQVRLAHHAALRVPAGDLSRTGAARQAARRGGELGPPRGRHRLHELQEVAGQEVDTGGRSRSGSRRRRALVRAGQGGVHHHRTVDRGGGHPDGQEGLSGLRGLPVPDRPDAPATLRLRRGLHDQRQGPAIRTSRPS